MLTAALSLAVFMVIVGVGQMFVITLGPGNVDLSLPANIGLASAVAMKVMDGSDAMIAARACWPRSPAASRSALANYLLIWALRIPPIIATLSASFIIQSIDISYGRGLQIKPPPGFADFTNLQVAGLPVLAILTVLFTIAAGVALQPHDLWPLGARDRPEHPRRLARRHPGRPHPLPDLRAVAARWAASTARCSPAISAAPMSTSATNICWPRSPSW